MTLLVFNINWKTPQGNERLKSPINWDETLINNMRILVGILFGAIAFGGLRQIIIFLTSVSLVGLRKKKNLYWLEAENHEIIFGVSNRRLGVSSTVHKIFVKSIGYLLYFS